MNDATVGPPPGWPTDEHRSRVAARARTLRKRRLALQATTVALVVVLLGGGFALLGGGSGPSGVKVVAESSTTTTSPAVTSAPTPKGWRIVDFGDARLAAPPNWSVTDLTGSSMPCVGHGGLAQRPEPGVELFRENLQSCSAVIVEPGTSADHPARAARTIHGIRLYLISDTVVSLAYAVPELGVTVALRGVDEALPVLETLTSSARRVVLAAGPAPRVPDDWRTVEYGGITVRVPPTMPVKRLGAHNIPPGVCSVQMFSQPGVFLGKGFVGVIHCGLILAGVVPAPTDGLWIRALPDEKRPPPTKRFIDVTGLRLWLGDSSVDPTLTIEPQREKGGRLPTVITLGLGADPTIARTILYSIRATDRSSRQGVSAGSISSPGELMTDEAFGDGAAGRGPAGAGGALVNLQRRVLEVPRREKAQRLGLPRA